MTLEVDGNDIGTSWGRGRTGVERTTVVELSVREKAILTVPSSVEVRAFQGKWVGK